MEEQFQGTPAAEQPAFQSRQTDPVDHTTCLKVGEFERYAAQQAAAAQQVADYQKIQNGSVQKIDSNVGKIFDILDDIRNRQVDTYKTITEINGQSIQTMDQISLRRANDNEEHDRKFKKLEARISKIEDQTRWELVLKHLPKKAWAMILAATAVAASVITILYYTHVIH